MPKERSLRAAIDRHQGRDYKLEKQKKLQKEARKKNAKKAKPVDMIDDEDEDMEEEGGVALNAALDQVDDSSLAAKQLEAEAESEDEWEDEEDEVSFDISRLNDSDSDSDSDEEEANPPVANKPKSNGAKPASSLASQLQALMDSHGINDADMQVDEELDDDEEDASSIALSDIPDTADTEDMVPHQRLTINNTQALTAALKSIQLPYSSMTFSEYQTVTSSEPTQVSDINDDLNRELSFYAQSLSAAKAGRQLLKNEGVLFTRPPDYFAEMVKSDEHMGKIKAKLIDEATSKKASAEARKQRDLKKFGKQVQQEKLKERAKEKRDMLEKVNILKRKRQSSGIEADREEEMFDVALEDAATTQRNEREARKQKAGREKGPPNAKRAKKNEKFGFGGKKRFSKSGDAVSTGDMSGFSTKRMKGQIKPKKGGSKRLGKSRRAKL